MDERTGALLAITRDGHASAAGRDSAWTQLFGRDPLVATATAFDLLAGEPRIKPSHALVIDPGDTVRRRWTLRVAAAAALLAAPVAAQVFEELRDELAEDADLAGDVLRVAAPAAALSADQLAALRALGPAHAGHAATSPS